MMGRTHDLAGFTALLGALLIIGAPRLSISTFIVSILANQIGSLFPDLDQATSNAWDRFPAGHYFGKIFAPFAGGHRHITHSILGLVIFGFLTYKLSQLLGTVILVDMDIVWQAYIIGYLSHLFMDSLTDEGLPLLWPIRFKFGFPPTRKLRPATGGFFEKLLIFPSLLGINFYLIYAYYDKIVWFFKNSVFR